MNVTLKPEHQRFVDSQIQTGRFAAAEQVVAEAIASLMLDPADKENNDENAALQRSEEQLARGEGRARDDIRQELRAKYGGRLTRYAGV